MSSNTHNHAAAPDPAERIEQLEQQIDTLRSDVDRIFEVVAQVGTVASGVDRRPSTRAPLWIAPDN